MVSDLWREDARQAEGSRIGGWRFQPNAEPCDPGHIGDKHSKEADSVHFCLHADLKSIVGEPAGLSSLSSSPSQANMAKPKPTRTATGATS